MSTIFCRTTSGGVVFFTVIPKLVDFPLAKNPCDNHLYFCTDTISEANVFYCSSKTNGVRIWNDDPFSVNGHQFFEINYRKSSDGLGARFWLQLEARHIGKINRYFIIMNTETICRKVFTEYNLKNTANCYYNLNFSRTERNSR